MNVLHGIYRTIAHDGKRLRIYAPPVGAATICRRRIVNDFVYGTISHRVPYSSAV